MNILSISLLAIHVAASSAIVHGIGRPAAGPLVSLEWLRQHMGDPQVVVIAVDSDRSEFESAHIPGARFVSHMATIDPSAHRLLAPELLAAALSRAGATDGARIVIYGDDAMSVGWLFMALTSIGHGDGTSVLDGNFRAWAAAGHPVEKGRSAKAEGRLTARPAADLAVDLAWVRAHLKDPAIKLLDVRSPQEWSGGTIPGAGKLLWEDLYSDLGSGRFKPPAALKAMFEQAGVGPGQTAVTYCAVGMRASLAYFAARLAGIPVRVYTGSWADWTSDKSSPIEK
jgi:thiosulfate/3-mercaptopyruvate sulfurtransferase